MIKSFIVLSFLSFSLISKSQSDSTTSQEITFIQFEPYSLYMKVEGSKSLDAFIGKLSDWTKNFNYDVKVALTPKYFKAELDSNQFIGVNRAKIVLEQLCSRRSLLLRNQLYIQDPGPYDRYTGNKIVEPVNPGISISLIPE